MADTDKAPNGDTATDAVANGDTPTDAVANGDTAHRRGGER